MATKFKVGEAPWEVGQKPMSFPVGQAPWEVAQTPVTPPTIQEQPQESGGMLTDALRTLVLKPAIRTGQLAGYGITRALGIGTEESRQKTLNKPVTIPAFSDSGITINPQKALGEGGGAQLFSDALKSAAYLAPYGKIAGVGSKVASTVFKEGTSRIAGGALAGATTGYATDVAGKIDEKGFTGESFVPGFGTLLGGITGGLIEGGGVAIEKLSRSSRELGKELEQQSFRLTPSQKTNLGSKLDDITNFSADNIPAGTPEQRFEYADDLYEHFEEKFQKAIESKVRGPGFTTDVPYRVGKKTFLQKLEALKESYKYDRDFDAINKQIDDAVATLNKQYPEEFIPVDKLNIFKRSTYKGAYNKAGSKVLDTVEHDIGDVTRMEIEDATKALEIDGKSIGDFNKEYGNLIQLKKLLKIAQNRPELGFGKRITSRIIGGLIGNALGGIPGLIAGEVIAEPLAKTVAGTTAKTGAAKRLLKVKPRTIGSIIQRLRP